MNKLIFSPVSFVFWRSKMSKELWKPGNMLYPLPTVMVSVGEYDPDSKEKQESNILTIAWCGTICSTPPMVSISVQPIRYSHHILMEKQEFVINLTTTKLTRAMDFCGVRSGRDMDKFEACHLTREKAAFVKAPLIKESPVNIECSVTQVIPLGSHDLFLAKVEGVHVDRSLLDDQGRLKLEESDLVAYNHGEYYSLGELIGKFGYSVKKQK